MNEYIVQKRIANTEQWATVTTASTFECAVAAALRVEGGASTGVRVCRTDCPYVAPVIVAGC